MRTALALGLMLLALPACAPEPAAPAADGARPPAGPPAGTLTKTSAGGQVVHVNDVSIEIAPDLPARGSAAAPAASGTGNGTVLVLRGWPIELRAGRIHVAGQDFGEVPAGSQVLIAREGVHVAGVLRGPLPPDR